MHISYQPLWNTLKERGMRKEDLRLAAGLTTNMIANMGKGKNISGNVKKCAVGKHPKSEKFGSTGQAACCARIHSRYFTGGSPSGLRV